MTIIVYAGEEDLLAHYYHNFDERVNLHFIGTHDNSFNGILIPEGGWQAFIASEPYQRKKSADRDSYLWDELLQRTSQNALDGTLLGDGRVFDSQSAIFEMAKEPRFVRREFAKVMLRAIANFPDSEERVIFSRCLSFMPSFYKTTGYVFLQLRYKGNEDYDTYYRPKRRALLEIACGVAKNKFPHLSKIVGISIDAPKFTRTNSEDFALLKCDTWPEEQRRFYEDQNKGFEFFESPSLKTEIKTVSNFPGPSKRTKGPKVGRNELCPCGSGKKYKKCHGPLSYKR